MSAQRRDQGLGESDGVSLVRVLQARCILVVLLVLLVGLAAGVTAVVESADEASASPSSASPASPASLTSPASDLVSACGSPNPYLAATRFVDDLSMRDSAGVPVLLAFQDTPEDGRDRQVSLAFHEDVGAAYGLAFDAVRLQLYVGAYMRRGVLFAAGGPGGIYRVDVDTGNVGEWAGLSAGPRGLHALSQDADAEASEWVGRAGLGDLEVGTDSGRAVLFAANLYDGRIHRLGVPDGEVLGSFAHGGSGTDWGAEARPFGLAFRGDRLFHGVIDATGESLGASGPVAHIYRSLADGSEMREVAAFGLNSSTPETSLLVPWETGDLPVVADIEFLQDGSMVVGFRNLSSDTMVTDLPGRLGDIVPAEPDGDAFRAVIEPERFDDTLAGFDESLVGSLATLPGLDLVVGLGHGGLAGVPEGMAVWFDASRGDQARWEPLDPDEMGSDNAGQAEPLMPLLSGMGDVEVLCAPDTPLDPALVASATSESAVVGTATQVAVATAAAGRSTRAAATLTSIAPTVTALAPTRDALATRAARKTVSPFEATAAAIDYQSITASCDTDDPYFAVANQGPAAFGGVPALRHRVSLAAVNQDDPIRSLVSGAEMGPVHGLAYDAVRGHLYAAAVDLGVRGPAGPGAIYRLDLTTGLHAPWVILPSRTTVGSGSYPNNGFGDIELNGGASELYAVNLYDRHIYRLSVPEGRLLGVFPHGATGESWQGEGFPFALGFRDGWLYHGVVPDIDVSIRHRDAIVYRSRPDGSEMSEVVRFQLSYRMPRQSIGHSAAYVADIEFGPDGNLILGLRDGITGRSGDLLPTESRGHGHRVVLDREHYDDRTTHDEAVLGGLARFPDGSRIVAAADAVRSILDTGVIWSDTETGRILHRRRLFTGSSSPGGVTAVNASVDVPGGNRPDGVLQDDGFLVMPGSCRADGASPGGRLPAIGSRSDGAASMLRLGPPGHAPAKRKIGLGTLELIGDVEPLCVDLVDTPTPTPLPTPTPTLTTTPTRTASPTVANTHTPTPSSTVTPTRVPRPLYLPVALAETCAELKVHADVVLVVDVSTSMRGLTRERRSKIKAVQDAAMAFLGLLELRPDGSADRVALVGFNRRAWIEQPLDADAATLTAALERLPNGMAEGTRLDLAIETGSAALAQARRREGRSAVMILLTDGLPNGVPLGPGRTQEETVLAAAELAKAASITIYAIGVGTPDAPDVSDRINADLMRAVASAPDLFFHTVSADELARIYAQIAYTIGCPPEVFWGRR